MPAFFSDPVQVQLRERQLLLDEADSAQLNKDGLRSGK
jgi:hypothetical protein